MSLCSGFEAADFVKGRVGHDRRTAGAVGADDDGLGVAVVVGGFHAVAQDLDLVVDVVADFAGQVDNGGMFAAGVDARGFPSSSAKPKIRLRKMRTATPRQILRQMRARRCSL